MSEATANSRIIRAFTGNHFAVSVREQPATRQRELSIERRGDESAVRLSLFATPDCPVEMALELSALLRKAADFAHLLETYGEETVQRYWSDGASAPGTD